MFILWQLANTLKLTATIIYFSCYNCRDC